MTCPVLLLSGLSVRRHQVSPQPFWVGDGVIQGLHLWGLTMTVKLILTEETSMKSDVIIPQLVFVYILNTYILLF